MVEDQSARLSFRPGDRVAVPWGLDVLEGTVVSSHGDGPARRVVVSVDFPDTDGEAEGQLVTLMASALEDAATVASERRPGTWLPAYQYEEALRRALDHLLSAQVDLYGLLSSEASSTSRSPWDIILGFGDHHVIIEAKALRSGQVSGRVIDRLLSYLRDSPHTAALLVANTGLSAEAKQLVKNALQQGYEIRAVKWRSSDDDPELGRAIRELLSAA